MEKKDISETLSLIEEKFKSALERHSGKLPAVAKDGIYDDRADLSVSWTIDNGPAWWTNGFWGGIYNQLYALTGKKEYLDEARASRRLMDTCFLSEYYTGLHHDVGFMWLPTAVADFIMTGDEEAKRRGLLAAQLLAGRYNPAGEFIRAWNDITPGESSNRGWVIIDSMMNISILYWATKVTSDPRFAHIAERHATTVMNAFIRDDGSVRHIVEFDAGRGGFVRDYGGQGMKLGSSWTRGQSWGIYGFVNSYAHTKRKDFLDAAVKIADHVISVIPKSYLIPVDFDQDENLSFEDSTASAIIACGLIELDRHVPGKGYRETAEKLLETLTKARADFDPAHDGIIQRCTGSYNGANDREVNFVYADYYYLEALMKLEGKDVMFW